MNNNVYTILDMYYISKKSDIEIKLVAYIDKKPTQNYNRNYKCLITLHNKKQQANCTIYFPQPMGSNDPHMAHILIEPNGATRSQISIGDTLTVYGE